MFRFIEKSLVSWKSQTEHLPLLLRGARQVGKTFIVEAFGEKHFENCVTINFEYDPVYKQCFTQYDPVGIINQLSVLAKQPIIPGKTLLFLDEIQEYPRAIQALRYFKERLPELHVISAGSLLDFALNDENFRMPVGRVQFMHLTPLSFQEFLLATGNEQAVNLLQQTSVEKPVASAIHTHLLSLQREYMLLGGMPAVIKSYIQEKDILGCQRIQNAILQTYRSDFGKYQRRTNHEILQTIFERSLLLIGQQVKYSKIDPDTRAYEIKQALKGLFYAGVLMPIYASSAAGLPLAATLNAKKYKLNFVDVGLLARANQLEQALVLNKDIILINKGQLAEQFVGQELLAYQDCYEDKALYFWAKDKGSLAEVDFLTNIDSQIIPIEVKAGKSTRLKSLHILLAERQLSLGVRISTLPLQRENNILTVPVYMMSELKRLIEEAR